MEKFHVAFYVLMELNAKDSYEAENKLSALLPTTETLTEIGKIRSKQWTVTELMKDETSSRPAE